MKKIILSLLLIVSFLAGNAQRYFYTRPTPGGASSYNLIISSDIPSLNYQIPLVSGTNIKTVESFSLVGSGNVSLASIYQPLNINLTNLSTLPSGSGVANYAIVMNAGGTAFTTSPRLSGTVTDVSVVSANGLAGSVATSTSTPAITLSTTITGVLKGNGTAISAAVSGTDYQAPGLSWLLASGGTLTGANTISGTTSNTFKLQFNNLGAYASSAPPLGAGLLLSNDQASTSGNVQNSPVLTLRGRAFNTSDKTFDWSIFNLPAQGTANPTATLQFRASQNGGSHISAMNISANESMSSFTLNVNGGIAAAASTFTTVFSTGSIVSGTTLSATNRISTGGLITATTLKTTNYTATLNDYIIRVDGSTGSFTIALPIASTATGTMYCFVRNDNTPANTITIDPASAELIGPPGLALGTATLTTQGQILWISSNGISWDITNF